MWQQPRRGAPPRGSHLVGVYRQPPRPRLATPAARAGTTASAGRPSLRAAVLHRPPLPRATASTATRTRPVDASRDGWGTRRGASHALQLRPPPRRHGRWGGVHSAASAAGSGERTRRRAVGARPPDAAPAAGQPTGPQTRAAEPRAVPPRGPSPSCAFRQRPRAGRRPAGGRRGRQCRTRSRLGLWAPAARVDRRRRLGLLFRLRPGPPLVPLWTGGGVRSKLIGHAWSLWQGTAGGRGLSESQRPRVAPPPHNT